MSQRRLGQRRENCSPKIRPLFRWNRLRQNPRTRTDVPSASAHSSLSEIRDGPKTMSPSEKNRQPLVGGCRFGTRLERYFVGCILVGGWRLLSAVQEDHPFGCQFQARGRCASLGRIQIYANVAPLNQDLAPFLEVLAGILSTDAEYRHPIPSRSLLAIALLVDCDRKRGDGCPVFQMTQFQVLSKIAN